PCAQEPAEHLGHRRAVEGDDLAQASQDGTERVDRRRQQLDRVAGYVLGDDPAATIVDRSARSRERDGPKSVGFGLELELLVLDDLGREEGTDQTQKGAGDDPSRDPRTLAQPIGIRARHRSSLTANHCLNASSTSAPAAAVMTAWSGL